MNVLKCAGFVFGMSVVLAAGAPLSQGLAAGEAEQAMCWRPQDLVSQPDEKRIRHAPYDPSIEPQTEPSAFSPLEQTYRGSIRRVELPGGEKLIALTFDLCENGNEISGYDGEIIDTLRRFGAKATFFASGKWLFDHRTRAEQLMSDPLFEVGGHSWTHRNFRLLPVSEVEADVKLDLSADASLRAGLKTKMCRLSKAPAPQAKMFRFPFGTCNAESLKAVNDAGLYAIQWDVVSGDPSPRQTAEVLEKGVVSAAKPGSIIVMHGNGRGWHTAEALPLILEALRRKGYGFATVSELLAKGRPVVADTCYELKPGDNLKYDKLFAVNDKMHLKKP